MTSVASILSAISDGKSLSLFKAIARSDNYDSSTITGKLNRTRKQFYSSMKKLMDVGLVKRTNGKYHLTSLGKVVFNMQSKVEIGIENHWKLKALDSIINSADNKDLPAQEYQMIIDKLIDNPDIKDILVSNKK
jgi:predicted transcriptional regulator